MIRPAGKGPGVWRSVQGAGGAGLADGAVRHTLAGTGEAAGRLDEFVLLHPGVGEADPGKLIEAMVQLTPETKARLLGGSALEWLNLPQDTFLR